MYSKTTVLLHILKISARWLLRTEIFKIYSTVAMFKIIMPQKTQAESTSAVKRFYDKKLTEKFLHKNFS